VSALEEIPEQPEAKRLLEAAIAEGPAHAYLFHGPPGVGKQHAAIAFAAELIGERDRVARRAHPDLYVLEPLGDQIRIDDIRALRRDLHMRPFEAGRRVYVVLSAEVMNDEAADALLKDLEEPPAYAVLVLVADDLGPLPETIRSRCQPVPFRRLSAPAVRGVIAERAPGLPAEEVRALARLAGGRLDRAERFLDPRAAKRRQLVLGIARAVYRDAEFEPAGAAEALLDAADECGTEAKEAAEQELERMELPAREAEQRVRRAQRGAERDQLLLSLEELAAWYRDVVVVAAGAEAAVINSDRLGELAADASAELAVASERAAELVRETWRSFEEYNVQPGLAFEALLIKLRRELARATAPVA
jgi:DNA polymerase III subunit delta'